MIYKNEHRIFITDVFNGLCKIDINSLSCKLLGGLGEYLLCVSMLEDSLGVSFVKSRMEEMYHRLNNFLSYLNQNDRHTPNEDELSMLLSIGMVATKLSACDQVSFMNIVGNLLNGHFHNSLPLKSIYYPGLLALVFWRDEDNLFRYSCEEKILLQLRECEDLLGNGQIYKSAIPISMLHSILYFLTMCHNNHIGTYKARMLMNKISDLTGYSIAESKVLGVLIRQDALAKIQSNREDDIVGYMGLISALYKYSDPMFALKQRDIHLSASQFPEQYLSVVGGQALGLLTYIHGLSDK